MTPVAEARETGFRVGRDPIATVHCMEDHDTAYDLWKAAGVQDRILVHFDGHLDFYWVADRPVEDLLNARSSAELDRLLAKATASLNFEKTSLREKIHIGNFIYPAIREGIVREFYWVLPDPMWRRDDQRQWVVRFLEGVLRVRPDDATPLAVTPEAIRFTLLGCPVIVCPMSSLPRFQEPVLLDIDVDYFVTEDGKKLSPYFEEADSKPWVYPGTVVRELVAKDLRSNFITLAYSVNGGYTPLAWKYLGDSLAAKFTHPESEMSRVPPEGSAAESYAQYLTIWDQDTPHARRFWQETIARDPSYRTIYATPAYRMEALSRYPESLNAYDRMIDVDPTWHVPHLGKGRIFVETGKWALAEAELRAAHHLEPTSYIVHYWLGHCAAHRKHYDEARAHWLKVVEANPREVNSHWALSVLAFRQKQFDRAIEHAQRCVTRHRDGSIVHALLAWSAWRAGRRRLATGEFQITFRRLLQEMRERLEALVQQFNGNEPAEEEHVPAITA